MSVGWAAAAARTSSSTIFAISSTGFGADASVTAATILFDLPPGISGFAQYGVEIPRNCMETEMNEQITEASETRTSTTKSLTRPGRLKTATLRMLLSKRTGATSSQLQQQMGCSRILVALRSQVCVILGSRSTSIDRTRLPVTAPCLAMSDEGECHHSGLPQLEVADATRLRQLWMEIKGSAPAKTFTARLMRLALAWDAQAMTEGGGVTKARQSWSRIIKGESGGATSSSAKIPQNAIVCDGTRILKNWGGTTHEVLITERGVNWNAQSYTSLSAVTRAMTGTNRNEPKFFELREGTK